VGQRVGADGPEVNRARLRGRRLTPKPRVTKAVHARGFHVERCVPTDHPAMKARAQTELVDTFPEAIALALEWAGPKHQEPTC
jgi:hypothetical protein